MDGHALELGPLYPDRHPVAGGLAESEPAGQLEQLRQDVLVQLQVPQLALALQSAQVDLVGGQVLGEPESAFLDNTILNSYVNVLHVNY